jgi:hypothetical protein
VLTVQQLVHVGTLIYNLLLCQEIAEVIHVLKATRYIVLDITQFMLVIQIQLVVLLPAVLCLIVIHAPLLGAIKRLWFKWVLVQVEVVPQEILKLLVLQIVIVVIPVLTHLPHQVVLAPLQVQVEVVPLAIPVLTHLLDQTAHALRLVQEVLVQEDVQYALIHQIYPLVLALPPTQVEDVQIMGNHRTHGWIQLTME